MARIARKATSEIKTLDDLLGKLSLLPDDQPADTAQLRADIMADLAPQGIYEKIVDGNVADIEIERERLKRWFVALVQHQTWGRIKRGVRSHVMDGEAVAALDKEWESGDGTALAKVLKEHRVDLTHAVAQAPVDIAADIRHFETELRNCENRRRLHFRDLKAIPGERRPAIPDAEVVR